MKIVNLTRNTILAETCIIADSFWIRFKGLMGKKSISPGNALLLVPCKSIHMLFMRFPIDAVFLDKNNRVVYLLENLKPWRVSPVVKQAYSVLELPAGMIKTSGTMRGDEVAVKAP